MRRKWLDALWCGAISVPLCIMMRYIVFWTMVRPLANDLDRTVFIASCVAVILLIVAGVFIHRADQRRKRRSAGQCPTCGYDLRATPDRCPECGAVVAKDS